MRMQAIDLRALLKALPELARPCTQNAWIDNDTLRFDVLDGNGQELLLAVYFDEVIVKDTDCAGDRKPCYGRVCVSASSDSALARATIE
jgi:hypothetical protein